MKTQKYRDALAYKPDIVLIMLGTARQGQGGVRARGKTLIEGPDIVKQARGPLKPLTREVSDVSGSTLLETEFVSHKGSLPPVINGLELIRK